MTEPWRVVVAFNDSDHVSDDWSWYYSELRDACRGTGVHVAHEPAGTHDPPASLVDLEPFREHRLGYILAEEGQEPRFVPYDVPRVVLGAVSEYFGIELTR
jgi:hypothetical protein